MAKARACYSVGTTGRTIAARVFPGGDLLTSIEEICKANDIRYGYVHSFGSFKNAGYMYLVPMDAKVGAGYGDVIRQTTPIEFLGGVGIITQTDKGATELHYHGTMCDKEGKVFGGHIVKGACEALTTIDVIIVEINNVEMVRKYDEETDLTQVFVSAKYDGMIDEEK